MGVRMGNPFREVPDWDPRDDWEDEDWEPRNVRVEPTEGAMKAILEWRAAYPYVRALAPWGRPIC